MKVLLLMTLVVTSGCANMQHRQDYREAKRNFVYEADVANEIRVYDSIATPFYGDCEDFAFTLQRVIGGSVYHVTASNIHHAILIKDGIVYDSAADAPYRITYFRGYVLAEMFYTGSDLSYKLVGKSYD